MKKAAKRKSIHKTKVKGKSSLLLVAVLIIAVVGVVVWAVIANSPGKTPHAANFSCALGTTNVLPGASMSIAHTGFADGESIIIFGSSYQKELEVKTSNSTSSTKYQSFTVPTTVPAGSYNIVIRTRYPVTTTTCSGGPFAVSSPAIASCAFNPTVITAGNKLRIIPYNFASQTLSVKIVGRTFANVVNIGTIPVNGGEVIVPVSVTAPQVYNVVLNTGYGVDITCTNVLTIYFAYNRCDFNKDTYVNDLDRNFMALQVQRPRADQDLRYDINGDKAVNSGDQAILANYISTKNPKYCTTLQ